MERNTIGQIKFDEENRTKTKKTQDEVRKHADTAFHTCFFSDKSLKLLCDKTCFKLIEKVYKHPGYWYYAFQKI